MLIIAGTSLAVYPAAGLVRYYRGHKLVAVSYTHLVNAATLAAVKAFNTEHISKPAMRPSLFFFLIMQNIDRCV